MRKTKNLISKTSKFLLVFGILFLQMSFPLNVLADNDDKTNNGTTEENTSIEETKPVFIDNICLIKNPLNTTIDVKELKKKVSNIVKVMDKSDIEITDEDQFVYSGTKITVQDKELNEITYTVAILGDYDEDGKINENDQQLLLDQLNKDIEVEDIITMDLNQDGEFNILDVTYPIFTKNTWENEKVAIDNLTNSLSSESQSTYVETEMKVSYFINGFQQDQLTGIEATLNYDKELLELIDIKVNGIEEQSLELVNNHFAYLLEKYNQDGILITFTFKTLKAGNPIISLKNIIAATEGMKANIDKNEVTTSFEILDYGKGGNVEENNNQANQNVSTETTTLTTNTVPSITVMPTVTQPSTTATKVVSLSNDNYIKSMIIKGYDIDFDKNTYEYSITVKNDVSSLDLTIILNSELASYFIEGNKDFKVGENQVDIIVKAEDGSTKTYTVKVNKEKKASEKTDDSNEQEENNSSKTVIIILIILVIIGLIYVIFKDDEEDAKESKK